MSTNGAILSETEHTFIMTWYIPALIAAKWTNKPGEEPTGPDLYAHALSLYYSIKQALDPNYNKEPYVQLALNGKQVRMKLEPSKGITPQS